jgi:transcription elongation factor Elf1
MFNKPQRNLEVIYFCPECGEEQLLMLPKGSSVVKGEDGFIEVYQTKDGIIGYVICGSCDYRRGE